LTDVPEIGPKEFLARRASSEPVVLLDVREAWELEIASLPGVLHIPMGEIADRLEELDARVETVVLCRSGRRSYDVARFLQQNGFNAVNLAGGILAWARDVDPDLPTY
jgi:rhodanese-related sulfurtransferase